MPTRISMPCVRDFPSTPPHLPHLLSMHAHTCMHTRKHMCIHACTCTCTAGEDYEPLDRVPLSFEVGELRKCINITILEDNLEEGDVGEIIGVQLLSGSSSDEENIIINFNLVFVSILDSDSKCPSLTICISHLPPPLPSPPLPSPPLPSPLPSPPCQFSCWDSHRPYMKLLRLEHKKYVCKFSMEILALMLCWELLLKLKLQMVSNYSGQAV